MTCSAAAVAGSIASEPPGGRRAGSAVGRGERGEVAVEAGRVPAPRDAVEGVRARPDRLVRPALPVDEVVPALVAGPRPVADLVAAPAVLGQAVDGVVVLGRGPILVLGRARGRAPATRAGGRRQVVAAGPGQPFGVGVVEGQRVEREVVGREGERRLERLDPVDQGRVGHVVQEVEADRARCRPRAPRRRVRRRRPPGGADPAAEARPPTSPGRRSRGGSPRRRAAPRRRRARRGRGWPRGSPRRPARSRSGGRRARAARRCRRRAAATASRRRGRPSRAPAGRGRTPRRARRRAGRARRGAPSTNAPTRAFGPRAAAPA